MGGLGGGEGVGVVDEVCGLVDEESDVIYGLAPSGVEAGAVKGGLTREVTVPQAPDGGVGGGDGLQSAGDVGWGEGGLAGAGEDEGLGGAKGGAPGFLGGVPGVTGGGGGRRRACGGRRRIWGGGDCGELGVGPGGMDSRLLGNDGGEGGGVIQLGVVGLLGFGLAMEDACWTLPLFLCFGRSDAPGQGRRPAFAAAAAFGPVCAGLRQGPTGPSVPSPTPRGLAAPLWGGEKARPASGWSLLQA